MDRLTNKKGFLKGDGCCYGWMSYDCSGDGRERLKDALKKLAAFEDLAEQGRLIELPCKVGDTLYFIENEEIFECIASSFDIRPLQRFVRDSNGMSLNFSNFGKTIFLTEDEANRKCEELYGNN